MLNLSKVRGAAQTENIFWVRSLDHPTRLVPLAFLLAIAFGTLLLLLPASRTGSGHADFMVALFTATSAISVTGLIVVDTATYWSPFGQAIILLLVQIGGFGIMTVAALFGALISQRLGIRTRAIAQAESRSLALGNLPAVLRFIFLVTLTVEVAIWAGLTLQLHFTYGEPLALAAWNGLFHAVSAFNNAGFSTYSSGMAAFAQDWLFLTAVMSGVVIGGLGFPVLGDLLWHLREPLRWSLHTKITLLGTAFLLILGTGAVLLLELAAGGISLSALSQCVLDALFHSVMTRSGGFNTIDVSTLSSESLIVSDLLMLIGGGTAGTAGGLKVSTAFVLLLAVWAEIRNEPDTVVFQRRISTDVQRQTLTLIVISVLIIAAASMHLLAVTAFPMEQVVFEVVSAFATVGLSTGITADLPTSAQVTLIILMFVGRVGTITIATGLALKRTRRPYRFPEERPIVG